MFKKDYASAMGKITAGEAWKSATLQAMRQAAGAADPDALPQGKAAPGTAGLPEETAPGGTADSAAAAAAAGNENRKSAKRTLRAVPGGKKRGLVPVLAAAAAVAVLLPAAVWLTHSMRSGLSAAAPSSAEAQLFSAAVNPEDSSTVTSRSLASSTQTTHAAQAAGQAAGKNAPAETTAPAAAAPDAPAAGTPAPAAANGDLAAAPAPGNAPPANSFTVNTVDGTLVSLTSDTLVLAFADGTTQSYALDDTFDADDGIAVGDAVSVILDEDGLAAWMEAAA